MDAANRPTQITSGGVAETYTYDADGNRATRTRQGQTTLYALGVWEVVGGQARKQYGFNGQMIAQRQSSTVTYLHGDHLGSVSVATSNSGAVSKRQSYDPWGSVRSGSMGATSLDHTGQRRDDTGLLFYNARYYDPAVGRFISADSIVPSVGALTASPHDATASALWGKGGGAANPQELNRYSYVNNNPVKNTDPTGHFAALLAVPLLAITAPAWIVPVAIGVGVFALGAGIAYAAVQVNNHLKAEAKPTLQPREGTKVEHMPSERTAKRAADRKAGWGKHGQKPLVEEEEFNSTNSSSKSPQGDPGKRTVWRDPQTGEEVMHHDPYGNYYPNDDTGVGPHYGVKTDDGDYHYTYPSDHDSRANR